MSHQQGLSTPRRPVLNIFDDDVPPNEPNNAQNPSFALTPCTHLSRMTIHSQSNGNARMKPAQYQMPATNFNDKLMQAIREEQEDNLSISNHPNHLDMLLGDDKISLKESHAVFSFSDDEESDEGDVFSSSLCPMSSPDRPSISKSSLFDDDAIYKSPSNGDRARKSIFDDDYYDEEVTEEEDFEGDFYDPTNSWLNHIYQDEHFVRPQFNMEESDTEEEEEENRLPRSWLGRSEKRLRPTSVQEASPLRARLPLQEIRVEDINYSDDKDLPATKKMTLSNRKPHKMRFMKSLSPPRYASKNKEREHMSDPLVNTNRSSSFVN